MSGPRDDCGRRQRAQTGCEAQTQSQREIVHWFREIASRGLNNPDRTKPVDQSRIHAGSIPSWLAIGGLVAFVALELLYRELVPSAAARNFLKCWAGNS